MVFEDSIRNQNFHSWRRGEVERSLEDLTEESRKILNQLDDLTNCYGFPSEREIGYFCKEGKIIPPPYTAFFRHIYQYGVYFMKSQLDYLSCIGEISPNLVSNLKDLQSFSRGKGVEEELRVQYQKVLDKRNGN